MAKPAAEGGTRGPGFILGVRRSTSARQVRYGDELEVRVGLTGFGRSSFAFIPDRERRDRGRRRDAKTVQVWFGLRHEQACGAAGGPGVSRWPGPSRSNLRRVRLRFDKTQERRRLIHEQ
jgi:hypothetical protein